MSGKKMAGIIVAIIILASAAAAISILIFFKTYEPKTTDPVVENSPTSVIEQSIFVL